MNNEVVLAVKNLSVMKGKKSIIHIPEFSVRTGEFIAVTGPNGAGKSTLLKALALLEPGFGGEISFRGCYVKSAEELLGARRRMAMVLQDPLLLRGSVRYNVAIGLKLRRTARSDITKRVEYWLAKLGIGHLADRDVRTLSGGEAQRVNLARAMVLEPDVLFLDEPFTYLDMPTRAAMVSELKEILGEVGTAAVMVTHDLSDIPYLADRMVIMTDGGIRQDGTPGEVLNHPQSRAAAEFLGIENLWPGVTLSTGDRRCRLTLGEGVTPVSITLGPATVDWISADSQVVVCVRPECVRVSVSGQDLKTDGNFFDNVFQGVIETVYPMGFFYRIVVWVGVEITAVLSAEQFPGKPKRGDLVYVYLPPEKIHLIPEAGNESR